VKIAVCELCGNTRNCRVNRKSGKLICRNCSDQEVYYDRSKWEKCSLCPKICILFSYKGTRICQSCYRRIRKTYRICEECQVNKAFSRYMGGKVLCSTCTSRYRMKDKSKFESCVSCTRLKPVASRTVELYPICYACYVGGFRSLD
jgi:hypothetical protein